MNEVFFYAPGTITVNQYPYDFYKGGRVFYRGGVIKIISENKMIIKRRYNE